MLLPLKWATPYSIFTAIIPGPVLTRQAWRGHLETRLPLLAHMIQNFLVPTTSPTPFTPIRCSIGSDFPRLQNGDG